MISVVLCHVADGFYGANLYPESNTWLFVIRNICNIFQMPLFCMASGYLFSKAYIDPDGNSKKDRLLRQIKNLLSIYILWCLIMGIFKIVLNSMVNYEISPVDLLLIWFKPIGVYWYLYVLMGLYLIFANRNKLKANNTIIIIALTIISLLASALVNKEGYLFAFRRIGYFGVIFYLGMLLNRDEYKKPLTIAGVALAIISIILSIVFWNTGQEIYHIPAVNLITAVGFSLGIILIFQLISEKMNFKILTLVGRNSLDVYLLHVFLAAGCRMVISKVHGLSVWMSIITVFVISLFVPILIGIVARKINVYDLFFKPYGFVEKHRKQAE